MGTKTPINVGVQPAKVGQNNPSIKSCCGASISEPNPTTKKIWIVEEFVWQFKHSIEYKNLVEHKFQEDTKRLELKRREAESLEKRVEELKQSLNKAREAYKNVPTIETYQDIIAAENVYVDATIQLRLILADYKRSQAALKPWSADSYTAWANGNQGYKWGEMFQFSAGTPCGKTDLCGHTVTIYGYCLRSSALGNIMFGCIGVYVGFSPAQLEGAVSAYKHNTDRGLNLQIHRAQYKIGYELYSQLQSKFDAEDLARQLPQGFKQLFAAYSDALHIAKDETTLDKCPNDSCSPCTQATSESHHGGNGKEYVPTPTDVLLYNLENKKKDILWRGKPPEKDPPPSERNYP